MRHRTFRYCVYSISPGLFPQPGNYVRQVNSFFGSLCVFLHCMCWLVTRTVSVFIPLFLWLSLFVSVGFFFSSVLLHTFKQINSHLRVSLILLQPEEPALFFKRCSVFFGRPLCNLVNTGALHVGNVSEATEPCYWLTQHTPPPSSPSPASKAGMLRRLGAVAMATATSGG